MRHSFCRFALVGAAVAAIACSGLGDPASDDPDNAASVTISRAADTIDRGTTLQLTAVVRAPSGEIVTPRVFWTSSDHNRVDVSETGLATGRLVGKSVVEAWVTDAARKSVTIWVRVPAYGRYTIDTIGVVIGPATVGQQPGETTGTPDASAIELPDGRIRLYHGGRVAESTVAGPGAIGSAISSDGVHFTAEPGLRHPPDALPSEGFASPLIYPLPGGGYRLFHNGCRNGRCGIFSLTSADGLSFTRDNTLAITFSTLEQPHCGGIVPIAGGRYRIYCSQTVSTTPAPAGTSAVFSATSSDLLNWTADPGVRIGPGAPALTFDARHPTAIVNSDGTVSLIYYRRRSGVNVPPLETIATSKDGLTFGDESDLGVGGTEPSFLRKRDGSMWIYYGNHSPETGSVVSVGRLNPIVR
jgi:hypothetical protein